MLDLVYGSLGLPIPADNGCAHKFCDGWKNTSYKGVYSEKCTVCGQIHLFEKDFD